MGKKTGVSCGIKDEAKTKEASQHLCEDDVRCPICLYLLVEPVRMPCSHCLCKACFTSTIKQTTLQCPVCRTRIGTFSRRAIKSGTLVDTKLWATIKKQFKEQLHLQELEMAHFAKAKCSAQVPSMTSSCPLVSSPAGPGEIGREFQEQLLQLRQAHQHPSSSRQQESEDRRFALALQGALNTPATRTRKRSSAAAAVEESDAEEDSDSCSNSDRSRSSSRKLFGDLTNTLSSANNKSGCTNKTKKRPYAPNSKENVRHSKACRKNSSQKSQQFPGCSKKPRLAGTAALNITVETETSEEEISFKLEDTAAELDSLGADPTDIAAKKSSCGSTPGTGDTLRPPLKFSKGSDASASTDKCLKNQGTSHKINKYGKANPASYKICVNSLISGSTLKGSNKSSVVTKNKRNNCNTSLIKTSLPKSNRNVHCRKGIPGRKHVTTPLNNVIDISGQSSTTSISPNNTVVTSKFTRKSHRGSSSFSEGSSGYSSMSSTAATSPDFEQKTSFVSPTARSSGIRVRCLEELQNVAMVLQQDNTIGEVSDPALAAAFLFEQHAAAAQLRQVAEDHKLAVRVQKNLVKLEVDRSHGSGEEYGLRSRRPTFRNDGVQTVRTCKSVKESSPCY